MSLLVYCSYPILGQQSEPSWVSSLSDVLSRNKGQYCLYRPWLTLEDQLKNSDLQQCLVKDPNPILGNNSSLFKIPDRVFSPVSDVINDLLFFDGTDPHVLMPIKDLYCLVRSQILIADISLPSYGEVPSDVLLAYMANIPVIGITNRFVNSPSLVSKMEALITAPNVSTVISKLIPQLTAMALGYVSSDYHKNGDLTKEETKTENIDHGGQDITSK